jgi:hypothetical protein
VRYLFAYEDTVRGGVDVGTTDLNGDGTADFLAGAGPTGGPRVRAFDGRTGDTLLDFAAYEESFRGGVNVDGTRYPFGAGNGILTGSGVGGGPVAKLFRGSTEVRSFLVGDGTARDGVNVADLPGFDRDDLNDVAASADAAVHFFAGADGPTYSPFAPFGGGVGAIAFNPPTTSPVLPDADRDGASDALERLAGTNPNQAPPLPPTPSVPGVGLFSGTWTGHETQDFGGVSDIYPAVWTLSQSGSQVTGTERVEIPGQPQYYAVVALSGVVSGNVLTFQDSGIIAQNPPPGSSWLLTSGTLTRSGQGLTGSWSSGFYSGGIELTGTPSTDPLQARWEAARAKLQAYYDANRANPAVAAFAHQMLNLANLSNPTDAWARGMVLDALEYAANDIASRPDYWNRVGYSPYTHVTGFRSTGELHVAQHLAPSFENTITSQFRAALGANPTDPLAALTAVGQQITSDHTSFIQKAVEPGVRLIDELNAFSQYAAVKAIPSRATETRQEAFDAAIRTLLRNGEISQETADTLRDQFGDPWF